VPSALPQAGKREGTDLDAQEAVPERLEAEAVQSSIQPPLGGEPALRYVHAPAVFAATLAVEKTMASEDMLAPASPFKETSMYFVAAPVTLSTMAEEKEG